MNIQPEHEHEIVFEHKKEMKREIWNKKKENWRKDIVCSLFSHFLFLLQLENDSKMGEAPFVHSETSIYNQTFKSFNCRQIVITMFGWLCQKCAQISYLQSMFWIDINLNDEVMKCNHWCYRTATKNYNSNQGTIIRFSLLNTICQIF